QFRIREDFNAEEQEGLGIYQVTQRGGERWSAARGYIHPHIGKRPNLRVETRAHATRILFEGKRAVGVEYRQGKEVRQLRARRERRGPMTSNFAECGGFLKTRPDLEVPDIQLHFGMAMVDDHGRKRHWGSGFSCHVCLLRPKSRGHVDLRSADAMQPPVIDPNFFGEPEDLESMVEGY